METKEYFEKEMFFSKTYPSFLIVKEGSTSHPSPLQWSLTPFGSPVCGGQKPQERGRKPPSGAQNRYAVRLADHQRSSPCCAGWDRLGIAVYSLLLIVHS